MSHRISSHLFAPCGMNCSVCYAHLKMKNACKGCLVDDPSKPSRCKECAIVACTKEKGIVYCYDCHDFPCKYIKALDDSYQTRFETSLIANSQLIKHEGMNVYLESEKKKWVCKSCNTLMTIHEPLCLDCGKKKSNR